MINAKVAEADELIAAKKYLPAKVMLTEFAGSYEGNGELRKHVGRRGGSCGSKLGHF